MKTDKDGKNLRRVTVNRFAEVRVVDRRKAIAALVLLRIYRRTNRRWWVHPMNRRRTSFGVYYHLVAELQLDSEKHLKYFRMSAEQMEVILSIVGPDLTMQSTNYRDPIEPKQRLAITLRFLAEGESFSSIAFNYRLGISTVCKSVHMTCSAIEKRMMATQIPPPTEDLWKSIASRFWEKWQFPNCLGAIDGKHITITAPPGSGSLYFNYKKTFSIVLLALVDADYKFTYIQVGDFGRASDGGVYASSRLGMGMEAKTLNVPADTPLPGSGVQGRMPYVIVGDAAFPLKTYLMRPFPGLRLPRWRQNFNYRLSSARMVVECAFGILTARWRVLLSRLQMTPQYADTVVLASCILHNFLNEPTQNCIWQQEAEETGDRLPVIRNMGGNRGSKDAYEVREKFSAFFTSPEGSL